MVPRNKSRRCSSRSWLGPWNTTRQRWNSRSDVVAALGGDGDKVRVECGDATDVGPSRGEAVGPHETRSIYLVAHELLDELWEVRRAALFASSQVLPVKFRDFLYFACWRRT